MNTEQMDDRKVDGDKIKAIKIINNHPVENYLKKVEHTFHFKGSFFKGCNTYEEVYIRFTDDLRDDIYFDEIEVTE